MNPKLLFFALIPLLLLGGCKKDEEEKLNSQNVTIEAGKTFQLALSNGSPFKNCTSDDTFVATVGSSNGLITAVRKGTCRVKVNNNAYSCNVTVTTTVNDIEEPLMQWGISPTDLIALKGPQSSIQSSGDNTIYYYTQIVGKVAYYGYMFTPENKLVSSMMAIGTSYETAMDAFVNERYMNVESNNRETYRFYVNGATAAKSTLIVLRYTNGTTNRLVSYQAYPH